MASPAKTATALLGTYASPATIAFGGTPVNSTALNMSTEYGSCFKWQVMYPSSPGTVPVTLQGQVSDDGTHWTNDGGAFVALIAASTTASGTYLPPDDELYVRMQVVNADTGVNATAVVVASHTDSVA